MAHAPPLQVGAPFWELHALPHAPQFDASAFMFVSQPFEASPSQSPRPAKHCVAQVPPAQVGVPPVPLHALLHAPQCSVFVSRFTSQPLATIPSQLDRFALHAIEHTPAEHDAVPVEDSQ